MSFKVRIRIIISCFWSVFVLASFVFLLHRFTLYFLGRRLFCHKTRWIEFILIRNQCTPTLSRGNSPRQKRIVWIYVYRDTLVYTLQQTEYLTTRGFILLTSHSTRYIFQRNNVANNYNRLISSQCLQWQFTYTRIIVRTSSADTLYMDSNLFPTTESYLPEKPYLAVKKCLID